MHWCCSDQHQWLWLSPTSWGPNRNPHFPNKPNSAEVKPLSQRVLWATSICTRPWGSNDPYRECGCIFKINCSCSQLPSIFSALIWWNQLNKHTQIKLPPTVFWAGLSHSVNFPSLKKRQNDSACIYFPLTSREFCDENKSRIIRSVKVGHHINLPSCPGGINCR